MPRRALNYLLKIKNGNQTKCLEFEFYHEAIFFYAYYKRLHPNVTHEIIDIHPIRRNNKNIIYKQGLPIGFRTID